jgi:hypothetical protein
VYNIIGINTVDGDAEKPINSVVVDLDGVHTLIFIPYESEGKTLYLSEINTEEGSTKLTQIVNVILIEGV